MRKYGLPSEFGIQICLPKDVIPIMREHIMRLAALFGGRPGEAVEHHPILHSGSQANAGILLYFPERKTAVIAINEMKPSCQEANTPEEALRLWEAHQDQGVSIN